MAINQDYFPQRPEAHPKIYVYSEDNPKWKDFLKVGYTTRENVFDRIDEQYPTKRPDGKRPYKVLYVENAMYPDGSSFMDHEVHDVLVKKGFQRGEGEYLGYGEWFKCSVNDVRAAILAVKNKTLNIENRTQFFPMRPEQKEAVNKTEAYFLSCTEESSHNSPKFLWNCKMRFGKTFASYQLAKQMGLKKILVLTFKPAVVSAWQEDLNSHLDFEGWQFISKDTDLTYEKADKSRPIVAFGSFQDFLGVNKETGGIKAKNEWVHTTNWDLVVFDEYHFGAWGDNAKSLFAMENEDTYDQEQYSISRSLKKTQEQKLAIDNAIDESWLPITSDFYLYLSGTPFRALNSGEFIEEQIYNWTYSDEQKAKTSWQGPNNPYESLPRMVMMTYKIPDSIQNIARGGEFNEFDLNVFFSANGTGRDAQFVYKDYVQKWLDLIRGSYLETTVDELKQGAKKPPFPYSDTRLLNVLQHTLWFLPNVASCYAMANLLSERQNSFYHAYKVNVCAGTQAGIGVAALEPVQRSMADPLETQTITLSCGKLTTGVTVKPWTGIFMLRNLSSPETYFQAAFRVQSPWAIKTEDGRSEVIKKECYVFDFALDRALKQISDYSCRLNINEGNPEKKVREFINFLPVIAYDGSAMQEVNAAAILDMAMAGTSATLLAKRWESALLVNVDNDTLKRLMDNPEAMAALMSIEGFRSLNSDIEVIINKSEKVKKAKKSDKEPSKKEKKELTEDEKEYKSKRKQIQEKLIKFAARIPIFMYLTDFREHCLKDVITQLEPELFKKVTGLTIKDFELLVSLGLFNDALMNDAVYKFKRYEDASLVYSGINKHEGENYGGWNTTISEDDYKQMFENQPVIQPVFIESVTAKTSTLDSPPTPTSIPTPEKTSTQTEMQTEPTQQPVSANKKAKRIRVRVGDKVSHKAFGIGEIYYVDRDVISVDFDGIEKKFKAPTAFLSGFLELVK